MALTKITSDVIGTGAVTSDHLASGAVTHSSLSSITTDNVSEGSTNTYFTNARARGSVSVTGGGLSYDSSTGVIQIGSIPNASLTNSSLTVNSNSVSLGGSVTLDTDDIGEGSTNLYFTNARAQGAISGGTGVTVSSGTISIGQDVATSSTPTFGNITTTGYIAGPATFTIDPAAVGDNTGTVVIAGNLQVDGTTTTINSTTMTVDDLNITLASGAANAAAANGAGITVDGASATITYDGTNDEWDFNKDINVTGNATITTAGSTVLDVEATGANDSRVRITAGNTSKSYVEFADPDDVDTGEIRYDHNTNSMQFRVNGNQEAITIDSSQNVLVGKTNTDRQTVGHEQRSTGFARHTADQSNSLELVRTSNDGDLQRFYKDGTLVGSIGTRDTGALEIGSGDVYLQFNGANDWIKPVDGSGNNKSGVSLGTTGAKFNNLRLSGTAYIDTAVGIGTTSLSAPLEVRCDSNNRGISIVEQGVGTETWKLGVNTDGDLIFLDSVDTTASVTFQDGTGNVGIGTTSPSELLTLKQTSGSGPELKFENGTSNHYIRAYDNNWNFLANASNVALTIKNSGNVEFSQDVGIGADPTVPLHIDKSGGGDLLKLGGGNISEYVVYVDSNEVRQQVDPDNDEANSLFTWFIDGSRKAIFESHGLHLGGLTAKADLDIKQKGNNWENGILLQHDNANTGWNIHAERQGSSLWFGYNADTSVALASQTASEILMITGSGNVGIRDNDPPSTLTVVGTNTADVASNGAGVNGLQISRTGSSGENLYAYMLDGSAASSSWAGVGNVGKIESYGNNAFEIGSQQNIPVVIGQNNTQKLRIKGDITAHTKWGATYTESVYTPNGGVQTIRIFEDALGKWVAVGYFAAAAYSSIQGTWSSVRGGPTGLGQSETTEFSADWGDSYPTEVRYLSATDFNNFQETKTIDFIHGVPRGRPWKQFFNNAHRIPDGGTDVSSSLMGRVQGPVGSLKNGWECRGAYDGFGRWHNPDYTHHRMSDSTNINCADTAFTTATSNHFNWEVASDAKISVHHSNSYSGQDGISSAGFGNDDNIEAQFDDYPTDRSNFQSTTNNSTSAVYVLIKLPEMQPVGLEGGRSRDHQPGEIVQTVVYERNGDVSATSGVEATYGYIDFTPKYGNSLLEFSVDTTTGQNGSVSSCVWKIYQGSPSADGTMIRRTGAQIQAGYDQSTDAHPLPFAWKTFYQLNDDKRSTYRYRVKFAPSGGTYWGHTYGTSVHSYFSIKEIKQEHNAKITTD